MRARYPPTPPFHCGENEIQASLISSASVGATPTPATISWEVIRLPDCKSGVMKYVSEATNWSVTSTSHHFGLVAQPAERPVVCGRVEGATPFGSANSNLTVMPVPKVFGVAFLPSPISQSIGDDSRVVKEQHARLGTG